MKEKVKKWSYSKAKKELIKEINKELKDASFVLLDSILNLLVLCRDNREKLPYNYRRVKK